VSIEDVRGLLDKRLEHFELEVGDAAKLQLATYLWLLAKWNRTINLTALVVDLPSEEALDRLIVEPLLGAKLLNAPGHFLVDLGTGGGSPAIPFSIATRAERTVMVESRARKCAFLREVTRELGLNGAAVENIRIEAAAERADLRGQADVVTVRAVRADQPFFDAAKALLRPGGVLCWFGSAEQAEPPSGLGLALHSIHQLTPAVPGRAAAVLTLFS